MRKLFLDHPASVGESYSAHFVQATRFAGVLARAAMVCMVHALIPALFEKKASSLVEDLHDRMVLNRRRHNGAAEEMNDPTSRNMTIGATQ